MAYDNLKEKYLKDLDVLLKTSGSFDIEAPTFFTGYQAWYTECARIIQIILPERLEEFRHLYEAKDRKAISEVTYSICDYLIGFKMNPSVQDNRRFNMRIPEIIKGRLSQQVAIFSVCKKAFESALFDIRSVLQFEIFNNEIEVADELAKKGFLRASGVVLGVALEGHLKATLSRYNISMPKTNLTIAEMNDELKKQGIYSIDQWRFITFLADIRNICAHNKGVEPTEKQVHDLHDGVSKVLKTYP